MQKLPKEARGMNTVLLGITAYVLYVNWLCRRLKAAGDSLERPS